MISGSGGSQPVTLEAPVIASSRGTGRWSSAATTSSAANVPSLSHSTYRQVAARAQGRRFESCSATVVATTSPPLRPSR
jgi:hypothetical protein